MEERYERNLAGWLGRFIKKPGKISPYDLDAVVAEQESGALTDDQFSEIENLDFLIESISLPAGFGAPVAAVEISWVIDEDDVDRAARRRDVLRKAGYEAVPWLEAMKSTPMFRCWPGSEESSWTCASRHGSPVSEASGPKQA